MGRARKGRFLPGCYQAASRWMASVKRPHVANGLTRILGSALGAAFSQRPRRSLPVRALFVASWPALCAVSGAPEGFEAPNRTREV